MMSAKLLTVWQHQPERGVTAILQVAAERAQKCLNQLVALSLQIHYAYIEGLLQVARLPASCCAIPYHAGVSAHGSTPCTRSP
jgi:hypothetical protein